ncbi:S8 family serine peptidase [Paenibacillus mesophilus]|uniref:S8 family serine peptidase n=1 Tax=Paenibacillus mesophilus TaxID=2582849 RepID=UPI001EE4326E|nr:S8 family serine peptidase [Paenibacillus mesophilus]
MRNQRKRYAWILIIAMMLTALDIESWNTTAEAKGAAADKLSYGVPAAADATWIVKWKGTPDPEFIVTSIIEREYDASNTAVARPMPGRNSAEWLAQWENSPHVQYIVPNKEVRISAAANDPFLDKQSYLAQTHTIEAWNQVNRNESIVIAVVDTGVDLDHPDLKGNLVPGINLIQPKLTPRDDNGHGTNVAGVIAAIGNNNKGVAGMLWKAGIMPIKALEPSGRGDEDKLGAGIQYAVDNGAKIVVLSVGLLRNDAYLQEIVQYAEDHNVLLIAATGNDEGRIIRYPAAYPSVLAVGGIREDNTVEERANYGPDLDLVAPWSVFTTAVGGQYEYRDGTSMAAPQVAAAAAMVWAKYPDMKVHEVRNLLRQTADDIAKPGWDEYTGYGLLRVDRALNEPYKADMYEPNDSRADAKPYSNGRMISAELTGGADVDWFHVDVPYDGMMTLQLMSDWAAPSAVKLTHAGGEGVFAHTITPGVPLEIRVTQGVNQIALQFEDGKEATAWTYRLSSSFSIYRDPFEDNDRQYKAYKLPPRNQIIVGTFDHEGDEDWYSMTFEQSGIVSIKVTPDTKRMDPVLTVQKKGERAITVDDNDDGEPELYSLEVFPGTYYYKVGKIISNPAVGEYALEIRYEAKYIDPNEPNDRSYQATVISPDTVYEGVFDRSADVDYYKFTLTERSLVYMSLTDIPGNRAINLSLQNSALGPITKQTNAAGSERIDLSAPLDPGTYYIRLGTDDAVPNHMYKLLIHTDVLIGEYVDIAGHWAQAAIVDLAGMKIVEGYGTYLFHPDRTLSRSEAVTLIVKAFGYVKKRDVAFPDVPPTHWAYEHVAKAMQAGIVQGYPDGRFNPEGSLSRVEMAVLFAKAIGLGGKLRGEIPFADIDSTYWALPILKQMKAEGWITGYDDDTFRPDLPTTRAEFAAMLSRIVHR